MAASTAAFLLVGWMAGGRPGMILALVPALALNAAAYFASAALVLRSWGAHRVEESEAQTIEGNDAL